MTIKYTESELNKHAEIELKHIQIELENKRYQHLRHFIDQYFCYKKGYVKKSGSANWEGIVWKEAVSLKAMNETSRTNVVKEHVIPLKRIAEELAKLAESNTISSNDISNCLDNLIFFATITKEEDKLLRDKKLHSKMPAEYDLEGHCLYKDPHARYKAVGIEYKYYPKQSCK